MSQIKATALDKLSFLVVQGHLHLLEMVHPLPNQEKMEHLPKLEMVGLLHKQATLELQLL